MRYEHAQNKEFEQDEINKIWQNLYRDNPEIYNALKEARSKAESKVGAIGEILESMGITSDSKTHEFLFQYWDQAGLQGTPQEFFTKYITTKGYKFLQLEKYDYNKDAIDNSKTANNNMLIQLMQNRLRDLDNREARITPGGFVNASRAALIMRIIEFVDESLYTTNGKVDYLKLEKLASQYSEEKETLKPEYDPCNPMTMLIYNQQNQAAGKLIGIFANQNTNHQFSSLLTIFELNESISFCGHYYKDLLNNPNINIDLNVAEFLAASVDAVKDPVLNFLNLNEITADAGALLARLGYTSEEIGYLFNQPIIKELCNYVKNNNIGTDVGIEHLFNKYDKDEIFIKNSTSLSTETLINQLIQNKNGNFNAEIQVQVLKLFKDILLSTQELSNFINATKFTAANSVKSSFGGMYAQKMRVENYLKDLQYSQLSQNGGKRLRIVTSVMDEKNYSPLKMLDISKLKSSNSKDIKEYIKSIINNPLAFEQAMYDCTLTCMDILNEYYYPYETPNYKEARKAISKIVKGGFLDENTINDIHRELLCYILAQEEGGLFDGTQLVQFNNEVVTRREYYLDIFPKILAEKIGDENSSLKKKYAIFEYLSIESDIKGNSVIRIQDSAGYDKTTVEKIKESWEHLYDNDPELATDLFLYNYHLLGFGYGHNSFINLAPSFLKTKLVVNSEGKLYTDILRDIKNNDSLTINLKSFIYQFILNHTENKKLVTRIIGDALEAVKEVSIDKKASGTQFVKNSFVLDIESSKFNKFKSDFLISDPTLPKDLVAFKPCLNIDGVLYVASVNGLFNNISSNGKIIYEKVQPLGKKGQFLEYRPANTQNLKYSPKGLSSVDDYAEPRTALEYINGNEETVDNYIEVIREVGHSRLEYLKALNNNEVLSEEDYERYKKDLNSDTYLFAAEKLSKKYREEKIQLKDEKTGEYSC